MAFTSDERRNREIYTWIDKANTVLLELYRYVITKLELNTVKLLIFKSVFVPIFTYVHESWVVIKRVLYQVQAAEMTFLRRIHGVSLRYKVRSCKVGKALNVEPLLIRREKSQLLFFCHVTIMPQEISARQALLATATEKRPRRR